MKPSFVRLLFVCTLLCVILPVSGQELNQRDDQGRRQGPWQGTYPSGRIRYQGQFVNDKPTGVFRYFFNDGALRAELTHSLGNDTVLAVYYHRNRQRMATGQFVNNQRAGLWVFFSEMGVKLAQSNYEKGILNGTSTTFFPSGEVAETVEYRQGVRQGEWIQYFEDTSIRLKAFYDKDKLHGPFRLFHQNGKPLLEATYKQNLAEGTWKYFSDNGELEKETVFKSGMIVSENIYIERETEITIPLQPTVVPNEDVFRPPF